MRLHWIFWIYISIAIVLDILESYLMKKATQKQNYTPKYLGMSLTLFAISGYIYYLLIYYKKPSIVWSIWDVLTLVIVTIILIFYYHEKYTMKQLLGILVGISSVLILSN